MERLNEDSGGRSPMRRPGASRAERRQEARVALRRVDWLLGPLVFWSGTQPARETVPGSVFRSVVELLARRLSGLPAGIYAVRLTWPSASVPASPDPLRTLCRRVNPQALEVRPIREREVSEAARSLRGLGRHTGALGKWLDADVESWRQRAVEAFPRLTAALKAARKVGSGDPATLAIEELCWWMGTEADRPSRRIPNGHLREWLGLGKSGPASPGRRAGWQLAGQRRLHVPKIPEEARPWYRLGAAMPSWPIDVLDRCVGSGPAESLPSWTALARGGHVASPEAAVLAREAWWASCGNGPADLMSALSRMTALLGAVARAGQAWERRGQAIRGILHKALERAQALAVSGNAGRDADPDPPASRDMADDEAWVGRLVEALQRRRRGTRAAERGTRVLRDCIVRLLRDRLGAVVDAGRVDRLARIMRDPKGGAGSKIFGLCSEVGAPISTGPAPEWPTTWAGLAGRLQGWGGVEGMAWISDWIDVLGEAMAPGARHDRALRSALHLVELWCGAAGGDAVNLARLGQILAVYAGKVVESVRHEADAYGENRGTLRQHQVRWMLAHPVRQLAMLGRLSAEDARFLVHTGLIRRTVAVVNRRPDRLGAFVALSRAAGVDAEHHAAAGQWAWFFASSSDALLGWALVQRGRWISAGFLVEWQAASIFSELLEELENQPGLERFLIRRTTLLDRVLASASRQPADPPSAGARDYWADVTRRFSRRIKLFELAWAWGDRGFHDTDRLVDEVLQWWEGVEARQAAGDSSDEEPVHLGFPGWTVESVLLLSEGRVGHVCGILSLAGARWFRWERVEPGWKYLATIPGARDLVREAWVGKPGVRAAIDLVGRFGLGARLWIAGELDHGAAAWLRAERADGGPAGRAASPVRGLELPADQRADLARIAAHRKLSAAAGSLPAELGALIDRPARLREERDRLRMMVAGGGAESSRARRLANLEARLGSPGAMAEWLAKDLRRTLPRVLFQARWDSLNALIDRGLRRHWRRQFTLSAPVSFDEDWLNALLLGAELTSNRALWRRLVRHEAAGDRNWRWQHPGNRSWIGRASAVGIRTERWLGPHTWTWERSGETWRIHAEDNPLRVLQMGNWFDTCLQRTGMNNFSVVANAVEANKRVLYLTNGRGVVTGRKLVALVADEGRGVLIGFRSYGGTIGWHELSAGKAAGPWVKIRFDLACARLAREAGAWFAEGRADADRLASQCGLFAEWYNDGPEPFDWWVAGRRYWVGATEEPNRDAVLLEAAERFGREQEDARLATWRALVWLGEDARPLWSGIDPESLSGEERRHLAPTAAALGLHW